MKLVLGITAVLFAATACGGGDKSYDSASDLASAFGCEGFEVDSDATFVTEAGQCQVDGDDLGVATFKDNTARDQWLDIASGFGGLYLVGDKWVVSGKRTSLEAAKEDIGGEVRKS